MMRSSKHVHRPRKQLFRTVRIVGSANAFFFVATLLVLGLFIMGNYQEFLDSSQVLLLQVLFFSGLLTLSTGLFYVVSLVTWMISRRRLVIVRLLYGLLSAAVGAGAALAIGVLQAVVRAS